MEPQKWYSKVILLAFPITYLGLYWRVSSLRGPFFINPNHDPSYAYLGNMLSLAIGREPFLGGHPGTPVQVLGAIVIRVAYFIFSFFNLTESPFRRHVLRNPETYLSIAHGYYLFAAFFVLAILGFVTFWLTRDLILSCILQTVSIMLYSISFPYFFPEQTQLIVSYCISIVLIIYLFVPGFSQKPLFQIILPVLVGLGIATKFTFLPFVLCVGLIPGIRKKILAIAMILLSFITFTLPIAYQYNRVIAWVLKLATRGTGYGAEETKFIESNFFNYSQASFSQNPAFFILYLSATLFLLSFLVLKALAFLLKLGGKPNAFLAQITNLSGDPSNEGYSLQRTSFSLIVLIVAVFWFQFGMTLGHSIGRIRYFFPTITLSQLLIFSLLLFTIQALRLGARQSAYLKVIVLATCIAVSLPPLGSASKLAVSNTSLIMADVAAIQNTRKSLADEQCPILEFRGSRPSTIDSALSFLDEWSGRDHALVLQDIDPNYLELIVTPQREFYVTNFAQEAKPLQMFFEEHQCAFLHYSYQIYSDDYSTIVPRVPDIAGFTLESVYRGKVEAFDRLQAS